jgi:hypothetical protein
MHRCSHEANGCNDRQKDGGPKKKEATAAFEMSKAEMKKDNMKGCMKYMKEAHAAMGLH